jgi:hypothetical protein
LVSKVELPWERWRLAGSQIRKLVISESTKALRLLRGYWRAIVVMRESEPARRRRSQDGCLFGADLVAAAGRAGESVEFLLNR